MQKSRVAIYARYSSDLQTDNSIEDQIRITDEYATNQGWDIFNHYTDHAISGASLMRPGIQMLLEHVQDRKFDIILCEAMDRLSRDQEDIAGVYKRAQFAGVKIVTLAEGEINEMHIGLKGTMNALFLKDLAKKTHRGLRGRIEAGKSAGGKSYGYDVVKKFDTDGEPIRGDRVINKAEAKIVNRIFKEYLKGTSPQSIARQLNKEGIAAPAAKGWGPSTIYGNRARGTGIINNELYIGRLIWDRMTFVKDPVSGKRQSRLNPRENWIIKEQPEMRIVDQDLWDAVKKKQGKYIKKDRPLEQLRRPKNLFSFLIKCGVCGGGCSMISQTHYGCSTSRNKGTCDNRRSIRKETLEQSVLSAMQDNLMHEDLTREFVQEYTKHMNELHSSHNAAIHSYRRELESNKRKLDKMVDAIADGADLAPIKEKLIALDARQNEIKAILSSAEEEPVLFHPSISTRYHEEIKRLLELFNMPEHRTEAADLLRSLIDKIVISPKEDSATGMTVDLIGDLAGILQIATQNDKPLIAGGLSYLNPMKKQEIIVAGAPTSGNLFDGKPSNVTKQVTMVAGARTHRYYTLTATC